VEPQNYIFPELHAEIGLVIIFMLFLMTKLRQ
jgi:hypothetical protein